MRIIYADSMFLLNFAVDYLLLLATGRLCALPLRRGRMALAAAWGGIYAVATALRPEFFGLAAVKIFSGLLTAAIAHGGTGRFARAALCFFAVSAAFGGAVYAALNLGGTEPGNGPLLGVSLRTLVLAFALCYALLSLVFRGAGRRGLRETHSLEISLRGRSVKLTALRDTGKELLDPSGFPVAVVEWEALRPLFPELSICPADPTELFLRLSALEGMAGRCRLLPCLTAAGTSLLAAFRSDGVLTDGAKSDIVFAAVTKTPLSPGGEYQALI